MSSHREAPEISKDPVADSADVYAFRSPEKPDSVTLIATYIPMQGPAGGPNFFEFGDKREVLYSIHIDNDGDGWADIRYDFEFRAENQRGSTFLYNVGPIQSLDSPNWNRRQFYDVYRWERGEKYRTRIARNVPCPPCNVGPLSTPSYAALAKSATRTIDGDVNVFAGQRADGFYVDLGSVFDLGTLRPFQQLHEKYGLTLPGFDKPAKGINALAGINVHAIALQVPIAKLLADGAAGSDVNSPSSVIGVWTTAYRKASTARPGVYRDTDGDGRREVSDSDTVHAGDWVQVSRLANPLFNEVLIPIELKDYWNRSEPRNERQFRDRVLFPELARLLPALYPKVFPNLAALNAKLGDPTRKGPGRADLGAILLTGLPKGIIDGFQNSGGKVEADLMRLNVAIPPARDPNNLGLLGGDLAGFPNGRRVFDDVLTVELRAIAGATYPLIDKSFKPDDAVGVISDGTSAGPKDLTANGTLTYLDKFPYLGTPYDGYSVPAAS
jgi:hypothetical protein